MKKLFTIAICCIATSISINLNSQTATTTTITGSLKVIDSLNVSKSISAIGNVTGAEVVSKDTMRALKDVLVDGNIIVDGKLSIAGQSTFGQELIIKKSILFGGGNELSFTPASATTKAMFYLGNSAAKPLPFIECPNPNTNALPQFINTGAFISRVPLGSGTGSTNSSLSFYSAPWDGSGIIEVGGPDKNGLDKNGLLINYFCGRSTLINTNFGITSSGKVGLGRNVEIGPTGENLSITLQINAENRDGIKLQSIATKKAFVLTTNNTWDENFIIYGDGKTRIGHQKPLPPHTDAMLAVDGKVVCKSLFVLKATSWADFVFKKKELENLENVEKYINENKHLPGIPSEEDVLANGYDINVMDAKLLEKIETLYLHIIKLEKEIKELKNH